VEVRAARQLEVVVEAVGDGRTDGVLRPREQVGHGLSHHVRGRVAEHLAAIGAVGGDDGDVGVPLDGAVEVGPLVVDLGGDRGLGQALPNRRRDVARRGACGVLALRSVRQRDLDRVGHVPSDDTSGDFRFGGR
jgi:hypothetical protein